MKEGRPGTSGTTPEKEFPEDAKIYKTLGSWQLRISKAERCLIIDTTDYHPGVLSLTKEDLEQVLKEL
jgi:hypothetical protein